MNAYLRKVAEDWIAAEPGRTGVALAKAVGVTPAQISTLRKHGRGAGWETITGFAKLLGIDKAVLERRAEEAWKATAPTRRIEYTDRYPNRARAIEALREEVMPASIADLQVIALQSDRDLPVSEWLDELQSIDRRRRRGLPAEGTERAAADTARLIEEVKPGFDEVIATAKTDVKRKPHVDAKPVAPRKRRSG